LTKRFAPARQRTAQARRWRVGRVQEVAQRIREGVRLLVMWVVAAALNWPRAEIGGFILSLIDGVTTVESLLHLSGMPAEETLGITKDLRARGIVVLREGLQES
jgi:hypothetical protein